MALATVIPFPVPQSRPQPEAAGSIYAALADRLGDLDRIVGDLRDENNIGPACHPGP